MINILIIYQTFKNFKGSIVGADPMLIGAKRWIDWENSLRDNAIDLKTEESNLIDHVWTEANGRPPFQVLEDA